MSLPHYVVLWPGGNTTALVTEVVPRSEYARMAREIMEKNKEIEQVGYLECPDEDTAACHLQMMGGEFCMNATRAAAFHHAKKYGISKLHIETSGSDKLVQVEVEGDTTHITLPGEFYIKSTKKDNYTVIDLSGIRHLITSGSFNEESARQLIQENKDEYEAVGVIYTSVDGDKIVIDPLVWVRGTDTFVRETGCGSGSIAAAIAAHQNNPGIKRFSVMQPSNEAYDITLSPEGAGFSKIQLSGIVKILN